MHLAQISKNYFCSNFFALRWILCVKFPEYSSDHHDWVANYLYHGSYSKNKTQIILAILGGNNLSKSLSMTHSSTRLNIPDKIQFKLGYSDAHGCC